MLRLLANGLELNHDDPSCTDFCTVDCTTARFPAKAAFRHCTVDCTNTTAGPEPLAWPPRWK